MMKISTFLLISVFLFSCSSAIESEKVHVVQEEKQSPTDWYTDAKFGMFIHWGLYSELAGMWHDKRYYGIGEWIMQRAEIPVKEYEKLANLFNPVKFDAENWVLQAKNAGMKYIVFTSKHHDGFAMFKSKASLFNIVDATPFKRDPLKELATACKKHGIKLGFYYSQTQDWYEKDAIGNNWDYVQEQKAFEKYYENKVKPQLTELLTNYGDIGILWFDTPQDITPEQSLELVNWVHKLQPGCLTTSRVGNGYGDYLTLRDHQIPDTVVGKPFEVLFTHNDSWGYTEFDKNFRSTREIISILSATNSKGGNLLLNIGPRADGTFPPESSRMLAEIGDWIMKNKEAVYATTCSPFPDLTWGYCTSKPGVYYFNVLSWPSNGKIRIPDIAKNAEKVSILSSGKKLKFIREGNDIVVDVPLRAPDPYATVIKVEYKGKPVISEIVTLMEDNSLTLGAHGPLVNGNAKAEQIRWNEEFGNWKHASIIDGWKDNNDKVIWKFRTLQPQTYRVVLNYSFSGEKGSAEGLIQAEGQDLYFEVMRTGDEIFHFRDHSIGNVDFNTPGVKELIIHPVCGGEQNGFINLRSISLIPL